jgi:hypothetical protein
MYRRKIGVIFTKIITIITTYLLNEWMKTMKLYPWLSPPILTDSNAFIWLRLYAYLYFHLLCKIVLSRLRTLIQSSRCNLGVSDVK